MIPREILALARWVSEPCFWSVFAAASLPSVAGSGAKRLIRRGIARRRLSIAKSAPDTTISLSGASDLHPIDSRGHSGFRKNVHGVFGAFPRMRSAARRVCVPGRKSALREERNPSRFRDDLVEEWRHWQGPMKLAASVGGAGAGPGDYRITNNNMNIGNPQTSALAWLTVHPESPVESREQKAWVRQRSRPKSAARLPKPGPVWLTPGGPPRATSCRSPTPKITMGYQPRS